MNKFAEGFLAGKQLYISLVGNFESFLEWVANTYFAYGFGFVFGMLPITGALFILFLLAIGIRQNRRDLERRMKVDSVKPEAPRTKIKKYFEENFLFCN